MVMYQGPGGGMFSPGRVAQGAAIVRAGGGDAAFPAWADRERALLRQHRTSLGAPRVPSYKKGGIVKKTGLALVHKGEKVTPKDKVEQKKRELAEKHK